MNLADPTGADPTSSEAIAAARAIMTDGDRVRSQYATDANLETRRSVWQPSERGENPPEMVVEAIAATLPGRVLEIGAGPGVQAARLAELEGIELVCTDLSPRFVEQLTERGIEAQMADAQDLPFADDSFDTVYAGWMLYHVPDVAKALREVRRVLRPGGTFIAATNGDNHTASLRMAAGLAPMITDFSSQNGEPQLRAVFDEVARVDIQSRAVFANHEAAVAYLESSKEGRGRELPYFEGEQTHLGEVTIFTCRRAWN